MNVQTVIDWLLRPTVPTVIGVVYFFLIALFLLTLFRVMRAGRARGDYYKSRWLKMVDAYTKMRQAKDAYRAMLFVQTGKWLEPDTKLLDEGGDARTDLEPYLDATLKLAEPNSYHQASTLREYAEQLRELDAKPFSVNRTVARGLESIAGELDGGEEEDDDDDFSDELHTHDDDDEEFGFGDDPDELADPLPPEAYAISEP